LDGKPEGKIQLIRPTHRWEDNIKMDLMKIGWECVDWIHMSQDMDWWHALVNMITNLHNRWKIFD
jgi:hypothetical protein